MAVWRFCA